MFANIIFWIGYVALWAAVVRYDIHMFQHNSYRVERYARWYRSSSNILRPALIMLLIAISFIPVYKSAVLTAIAVTMLIEAWREFRAEYKKPLVYTMRVWRMILSAAILSAAGVVAALYFIPEYAPAIAIGGLALPAVMLLANFVNKPLEAAISRWYYNDAKHILRSMPDLKIIGVTGSFGKTSTKHYLYRILSEKYNVLMTPGNFNTTLGVIRTVREHLKPHHQVFIVEMGAKQSNDIKEICDLVHPTIGIVTAVGEMHLETFKTVENIQNTKFELINSLPADGLGVINNDSHCISSYKGITSPCKLIRYAVEADGNYKATDVKYGANGVSFTLNGGEQFGSRLLGVGNLLNILAATAVADYLGVPTNKQKNAIARLQPVEHRLSMKVSNGITVLDDAYNSNPQGAKMALGVLKGFAVGDSNKRIVITPGFVEMGARQAQANKELGRTIAESCDYAIVVNATNRDAIRSGIEEGGMAAEKYFLADSLNHAHAHLAQILKAGDVVLYENDLPDNFK